MSIDRKEALGRGRILAFSSIRVVACIAIVILHTFNVAEILYRDQILNTDRMITMAVVYCLMWAVPCFLMVSGALLLDPSREIPLKKIYCVYLPRVLGALIVFVFVFRLFDMVMTGEAMTADVFVSALLKLVTGGSWSHLWYIYLLIGFYLLLPVYRVLTDAGNPRLLRYFLLICFIFLSLLPQLELTGISSAFQIQIAGIYPLYFLAGYCISKGIVKLDIKVYALLLVLATAGIIFLTFLRFSMSFEILDILLGSYASPFVVLQAVGVFGLFFEKDRKAGIDKENNDRTGKMTKIIDFFDGNSFGVYLIHMIWIRLVLRHMMIDPYDMGWWFFPVFIIGNFVLSSLLVWVLRKIPGLRKIL
ncbi:MAG: acyltransferase [Lachnospiraceae bacterium]|nr:acyltransferase [Lachnospiraceae bacterium]